jgi:hypothetical protein
MPIMSKFTSGKMQAKPTPWQARLAVECLEDRRLLSVTALALGPVAAADVASSSTLRADGDSDPGEQRGQSSGHEQQDERVADSAHRAADNDKHTTTDEGDTKPSKKETVNLDSNVTHTGKQHLTVAEATLASHPVPVAGIKESRSVLATATAAVAAEAAKAAEDSAMAGPATEPQAATDVLSLLADMIRGQDHAFSVAEQQPVATNSLATPRPDDHARQEADAPALFRATIQPQTLAWTWPGNFDTEGSLSLARGSVDAAEVVVVSGAGERDLATSPESGDSTVSGLLSADVPFDTFSLDRGVEDFFQRLDQLGDRFGLSLGSVPLHSWLVAAVLSAVAVESARRQFRSSSRSRLLHGADAADTLTWSLTLAQ